MNARPSLSAPGSTLDDLHNDLAALTMALRLAEYGLASFEERTGDQRVSSLYRDGAGGFEPTALVAWLKDRLAETENSIGALDGSGMPSPYVVVPRVWLERVADFLEWNAEQDAKIADCEPIEVAGGGLAVEARGYVDAVQP